MYYNYTSYKSMELHIFHVFLSLLLLASCEPYFQETVSSIPLCSQSAHSIFAQITDDDSHYGSHSHDFTRNTLKLSMRLADNCYAKKIRNFAHWPGLEPWCKYAPGCPQKKSPDQLLEAFLNIRDRIQTESRREHWRMDFASMRNDLHSVSSSQIPACRIKTTTVSHGENL